MRQEEGLIKVIKKVEIMKIKEYVASFTGLEKCCSDWEEGVWVYLSRRSKLLIFDIESQLRWFLSMSKVLLIFKK